MATLVPFRRFSVNAKKLAIIKNALEGKSLVEAVAVTENGRTIVAWHPDREVPYEFTKPIPKVTEVDSGYLIKDATVNSAMRAFKEKHPEVSRQELMRLTYTTKHRWFPRARDKRAKKDTPMDRPYL